MNTSKIQFGTVLCFNVEKNDGLIRVSGEPFDIRFSLDTQRIIVAGFSEPEFGTTAPKSLVIPQKGSQVAVVLKVTSELVVQRYCRSLRRVVKPVAWNFAFEHKDAKREIAARPVYEVVEFRLYKGQPVSENSRVVIAAGTAIELQAKHLRGEANDLLAPERTFLDITYRRAFFLKTNGKLTQCADPRPAAASENKPRTVIPVEFNQSGERLADAWDIRRLEVELSGRRTPVLR